MTTIAHLIYDDWRSGQKPLSTTLVRLGKGQVLAKRSIVALRDGSNEYFAFAPAAKDGTQHAKYILVQDADSSAGVKAVDVYDMGTFNPELIAWPTGITEAQKAAAFAGSPISLKALT